MAVQMHAAASGKRVALGLGRMGGAIHTRFLMVGNRTAQRVCHWANAVPNLFLTCSLTLVSSSFHFPLYCHPGGLLLGLKDSHGLGPLPIKPLSGYYNRVA